MRRPSPATVISLIALFVALGGTGYAAVKLNGKNIKNRTIAGKKLKNNTITGRQVREGRLGKVPSAEEADNAVNAATAAALSADAAAAFFPAGRVVSTNGVVKMALGTPATPLVRYGPFTVLGRCVPDNMGDPRIRVDIQSTEAGSAFESGESTEALDVVDESSDVYVLNGNHNIDMAAPSGTTLSLVEFHGLNGLGAACFISMYGIGSP